jgi:hypothetical protein
MQLNPVVAASRTISDLDDEPFDMRNPILHEMYESKKTKVVGSYINTSEVLAFEAIDKILNRSVALIYDKYIDSKKKPHVMEGTVNLLDLILSSELTFFDNEHYENDEDLEPVFPQTLLINF